MKKFNFSMQKLLEVRKFEEELARQAFVEVANELKLIIKKRQKNNLCIKNARYKFAVSGKINIGDFNQRQRYLDGLYKKQENIRIQEKLFEERISKKLFLLKEQIKETKKLLIREEKEKKNWELEWNRIEQNMIDDITNSRYAFNMKNNVG